MSVPTRYRDRVRHRPFKGYAGAAGDQKLFGRERWLRALVTDESETTRGPESDAKITVRVAYIYTKSKINPTDEIMLVDGTFLRADRVQEYEDPQGRRTGYKVRIG